MHYVFVYGSLKRNFHNHVFLKTSEFIGVGKTIKNEFLMDDNGLFPYVIKQPNSCFITGEVYYVNDYVLSNLDKLEANGRIYQREIVDISVNNKIIPCWIYLLLDTDDFNFSNYTNLTQSWEFDKNFDLYVKTI